jgi:anti-sigma factor RsiW
MTDRCQHADTVAAYLLGALADADRAQFEAHVADCPACHDDVVALRTVVDALPTAAAPVAPPSELRARLMATVHAEADLLEAAGPSADGPRRARRRTGAWVGRPVALAGSVAALALAGLLGFGLGTATDDDATRTIVKVRTVQAQVDAAAAPGGTAHVVLRSGVATLRVTGLPSPPRGYVYEVWLKRRGVDAPAPTDSLFSVDRRGSGRVALPSVRDVEAVLVTAEPDGGSPAPTSEPLISASL